MQSNFRYLIKEDKKMRKTGLRAYGISVIVTVLLLVSASSALAADPFLCPVVGGEENDNAGKETGVLNADANNGDNGVEAITPPVGTSLLPGDNQAGTNSNPNAHNSKGPGDPTAGPGHNPDFSPIWPGG
jgi:hypothetical protein